MREKHIDKLKEAVKMISGNKYDFKMMSLLNAAIEGYYEEKYKIFIR